VIALLTLAARVEQFALLASLRSLLSDSYVLGLRNGDLGISLTMISRLVAALLL